MLNSGDVIIFNPGDPHACEQVDGRALDYRCLNINPEVMRKYVLEITGKEYLPRFTPVVLYQSELAASLHELHQMILEGRTDFQKEELLLFLLEQLLRDYSNAGPLTTSRELTTEIKVICEYIESHYAESITLNQLTELTGLSKYYCCDYSPGKKGSPHTVIWKPSGSAMPNVSWSRERFP